MNRRGFLGLLASALPLSAFGCLRGDLRDVWLLRSGRWVKTRMARLRAGDVFCLGQGGELVGFYRAVSDGYYTDTGVAMVAAVSQEVPR